MGTVWIRGNGQAELRANLRAAIRSAGLTQSAAAAEAGIGYNHLVGFLANNNWLSREAAAALAAIVRVPMADLVGRSIFNDQTDRFEEFDFAPDFSRRRCWDASPKQADAPDEPATPEGRTRALCCQCGTLRLTSPDGGRGFVGDLEPRARMTKELVCRACGEETTHAVLRLEADPYRDAAETADHQPTKSAEAAAERDSEIRRLAGFNVDVTYVCRRARTKSKLDRYVSGCFFNDATERWRIELDPRAPARVHLHQLKAHWAEIASNDFGDIDWDPRTSGTLALARDETWRAATDDLVDDIRRFMTAEHSRMLLAINDEISSATRQEIQS